jgi:hypothetical protein
VVYFLTLFSGTFCACSSHNMREEVIAWAGECKCFGGTNWFILQGRIFRIMVFYIFTRCGLEMADNVYEKCFASIFRIKVNFWIYFFITVPINLHMLHFSVFSATRYRRVAATELLAATERDEMRLLISFVALGGLTRRPKGRQRAERGRCEIHQVGPRREPSVRLRQRRNAERVIAETC